MKRTVYTLQYTCLFEQSIALTVRILGQLDGIVTKEGTQNHLDMFSGLHSHCSTSSLSYKVWLLPKPWCQFLQEVLPGVGGVNANAGRNILPSPPDIWTWEMPPISLYKAWDIRHYPRVSSPPRHSFFFATSASLPTHPPPSSVTPPWPHLSTIIPPSFHNYPSSRHYYFHPSRHLWR
jgi:hypothetical protein